MPRVSNLSISEEMEGKVEKALPTLLSLLRNNPDINQFIDSFLTPDESRMFGKRIMIYVLLHKGYPADRIRSLLGISYEAIRVHKNNWQKMDLKMRRIIAYLSEKLF